MARSRNPRESRSIFTPKGTQRHIKDRRKSQLKPPHVNPPEFNPKSGIISQELVDELLAMAFDLGIPLSAFKVPYTMIGGRRKLNQLKKALVEKQRVHQQTGR